MRYSVCLIASTLGSAAACSMNRLARWLENRSQYGAVQRLFDRQHVGVGRGLFDESAGTLAGESPTSSDGPQHQSPRRKVNTVGFCAPMVRCLATAVRPRQTVRNTNPPGARSTPLGFVHQWSDAWRPPSMVSIDYAEGRGWAQRPAGNPLMGPIELDSLRRSWCRSTMPRAVVGHNGRRVIPLWARSSWIPFGDLEDMSSSSQQGLTTPANPNPRPGPCRHHPAKRCLNRPGMSGDSSSWKGWGHVRWFIEEVPAGAA